MNHSTMSVTIRLIAVGLVICMVANPGLAQTTRELPKNSIATKLAEIQNELSELQQTLDSSSDSVSDQESLESMVRKAFNLQMEIQRIRIDKATADLQRVKQQFESRKKSADSIVARQVAKLTKNRMDFEDSDSDVPASVLSVEGWKAWNKRDWRTALGKFKKAVELDDSDASTLNGLGWTYLHLHEHEKAIEVFNQAKKLSPNHGGVLNGLGQSLMALGKMEEAKDVLTQTVDAINEELGEAVAVKRGATAPWFALVRLHITLKERDAAIELAKRYLNHKPDDDMMKQMLLQAEAVEKE